MSGSATVRLGSTPLAAWSLAARSTIPLPLDGTVTRIELRHEKHPGVDDVWMVSVDGEQRHLDTAVAHLLEVGDLVTKDRWDTRLSVNGEERSLHLSGDSRAMLWLAPVVALIALALAVPRRRGATAAGLRARKAPSGPLRR